MATSESYNYKATVEDVISEALILLGVYSPGEPISVRILDDAKRSLQMMLKSMQARSVGLWLNREYALFFQDGTYEYNVGPTGTNCATSWVKTEVATAASSGANSIVIDSATGIGDTFDRDGLYESATPSGSATLTLDGTLVSNNIAMLPSQRNILIYSDADDSGVTFDIVGVDASGVEVTETLTGPNTTTVYSASTYLQVSSISISGAGTGNIEIGCVGDHVGIELDSGSMQWTNIVTAISTTLTLLDTLTGAVAVDNHVYTYTIKAQRPLEISNVRVRLSDGRDRPIAMYSRQEYLDLSLKNSPGTPNQVYYDPLRGNGKMSVWNAPNNVQEYLLFTGKHPIQDVDTTTNDIDVPQEWFEALSWNLAIRLAPKNGKQIDPSMVMMAKIMLEEAESFDMEYASTYIEYSDKRYGQY